MDNTAWLTDLALLLFLWISRTSSSKVLCPTPDSNWQLSPEKNAQISMESLGKFWSCCCLLFIHKHLNILVTIVTYNIISYIYLAPTLYSRNYVGCVIIATTPPKSSLGTCRCPCTTRPYVWLPSSEHRSKHSISFVLLLGSISFDWPPHNQVQ